MKYTFTGCDEMIDIHSHILPGLDDGAQTLEDSLKMAKQATGQGIDTIIATPHHRNGTFENARTDIVQAVAYVNDQLEKESIPLTVLPGQETRISGGMVEQLQEGEILPLNETSRYVFVELPSDHVPRYTSQLLFDLQLQEVTPVIVHPERNRQLIEHPGMLYEFVNKGTLTQVTAASVAGKFGRKIQNFSHQLIEANLTHFVASDAHNTTTRGFCMKEAYEVIEHKHGQSLAYELKQNAEWLIEGRTILGNPPERIQKKKFLGLF